MCQPRDGDNDCSSNQFSVHRAQICPAFQSVHHDGESRGNPPPLEQVLSADNWSLVATLHSKEVSVAMSTGLVRSIDGHLIRDRLENSISSIRSCPPSSVIRRTLAMMSRIRRPLRASRER